MISINSNVFSLQAQRSLADWTRQVGESYQRLSTGSLLRKDNPAGWAIADRMRARSRSLDVAARNTLDGISLVQVAESSLGSSSDLLVRMRELAVQSANGTLNGSDRQALQNEFALMRDEITRIANSAEFNGVQLLDGSQGAISLQTGAGTSPEDTFAIGLEDARASSLGLEGLDIGSLSSVDTALESIDDAIDLVSAARGRFGAYQAGLERRERAISAERESLESSVSRITDVDIAAETAKLARAQIMQQVSLSVLAQANAQPQIYLQLIQSAGI